MLIFLESHNKIPITKLRGIKKRADKKRIAKVVRQKVYNTNNFELYLSSLKYSVRSFL
jgi:LEA14-like dessication related protein